MNVDIQEHVPVAPLTTIGLGGTARYFALCSDVAQITEVLAFATQQNLPVFVLAGGSNTVFADGEFPGLVIKIGLQGLLCQTATAHIIAAAGETWESVVNEAIEHNWAGIECLAGIPGTVGATPVQNVGAYGQNVAQTIVEVMALDRTNASLKKFFAADCHFSYRSSRFKSIDANRYIITQVTFALRPQGQPTIVYPELTKLLGGMKDQTSLRAVRDAVLTLRRRKSMVVDSLDPNTRSCGSFFLNVVLTPTGFAELQKRAIAAGIKEPIPAFPEQTGVKVPAAWFIEQAGYHKGENRGGVGISAHHLLALINREGTTRELVAFANELQDAVRQKFGVELVREPVIVDEAFVGTAI